MKATEKLQNMVTGECLEIFPEIKQYLIGSLLYFCEKIEIEGSIKS